MLSWFRKKDDSGQPSRPDPVGVGRIETTKPEKKVQPQPKATDPAKVMNLANLRDLGVSEDVLTLLSRHNLKVQASEVSNSQHILNRDLSYEGYDLEVTADWMVKIMIGVWQHKIDRDKRLKALTELFKKALTPEQRTRLLEAQKQLTKPISFFEVVIWQEAERLARQEMPGEIDATDIEATTKRLRHAAWKKKANRLANAEARFNLKKKYGNEIPTAEFEALGRTYYDEYTKKHPFRG